MARLIDLILRQGKICLILLALFGLAGCAPPQQEARKRFFWPPGDGAPKIEYINFYHAEEDIKRGAENWLDEAVFGREYPSLIFGRPSAVASDGKGRVFVADMAINQVYVWDFNKYEIRLLKDSSNAAHQFRLVAGIAVDPAGQIYVSDSLAREIVFFGPDERVVNKVEIDEGARPTGLCYDPSRGGLYIADTGAHQVLFLDLATGSVDSFGKRGIQPGEFNFPIDVDVDKDGNLYVLDAMNTRVQVFDPAGGFVRQFGERGTALGSFQVPKSIAVSDSGQVYVTDSQAHRFVVFGLDGQYLTTVGGEAPVLGGKVIPGGFYLPEGIDVDATGSIWVVDSLNRMFHRFQYLTEGYLKDHPILPGQAYFPLGLETGRK